MTSRKQRVRLVPATETIFNNMTLLGDVNYTVCVNSLAEQYALLIEEAAPPLSDNEWNALSASYNGYIPPDRATEEAEGLAWHVSEGVRYDPDVRQFFLSSAEANAFIERIESWSISQCLAVIYKTKARRQQSKSIR